MENKKTIKIWVGEMGGYKLLDSGNKKKLEEINGTKIVRSEPRAWWKPELSKEEWEKAVASSQYLASSSKIKNDSLETVIEIFDWIKAKIKYKNTSKHIGIFPEQFSQWRWISEKLKIENSKLKIPNSLSVLNLFGYTGIASLVCAKMGAKVTHVDASKQSVNWARENQKLSGLENAPIRWIVDDVIKFIKKETKQDKKYDAIIMDPPSYGKGPKGEVWKIEEGLPELISACREILSDKPLFVIFNMYSTEFSSISVANLLSDMTNGLGGTIESGELAIKQEGSEKLLPLSIFALWQAK
ncbi:MAG: class I SAM-dependent methyltransferase [Patescibacteria group bacterium]